MRARMFCMLHRQPLRSVLHGIRSSAYCTRRSNARRCHDARATLCLPLYTVQALVVLTSVGKAHRPREEPQHTGERSGTKRMTKHTLWYQARVLHEYMYSMATGGRLLPRTPQERLRFAQTMSTSRGISQWYNRASLIGTWNASARPAVRARGHRRLDLRAGCLLGPAQAARLNSMLEGRT